MGSLMSRRRLAAFLSLVALALALVVPASVAAHAELVETDPAAGTAVEGTPTEITATFTEALLAEGSGLSLRDAAGDRVATGS